eukprot:jgi/Tetstr1/440252/TSEL_028603.t1
MRAGKDGPEARTCTRQGVEGSKEGSKECGCTLEACGDGGGDQRQKLRSRRGQAGGARGGPPRAARWDGPEARTCTRQGAVEGSKEGSKEDGPEARTCTRQGAVEGSKECGCALEACGDGGGDQRQKLRSRRGQAGGARGGQPRAARWQGWVEGSKEARGAASAGRLRARGMRGWRRGTAAIEE